MTQERCAELLLSHMKERREQEDRTFQQQLQIRRQHEDGMFLSLLAQEPVNTQASSFDQFADDEEESAPKKTQPKTPAKNATPAKKNQKNRNQDDEHPKSAM